MAIKGHIGQDVGSGLIGKGKVTSARTHDSQQKEDLLSGDEQAIFGDSAYRIKRINSKQVKMKFTMAYWTKAPGSESSPRLRRKGTNKTQPFVVGSYIHLGI